jgi:lipopolysaccharide exporter
VKALELYRYGRWIMLTGLVIFAATRGDDILVGKILGSTALGLYLVAFRLSNVAATEFASLIGRLTFPVYARIQDNTQNSGTVSLKRCHRYSV